MAVNFPAVWIFVVALSLQCSHYRTSFRGNRRIRSSKKIIPQIVELKEGTEMTYLNCTTVINGTKANVYWKKDGVLLDLNGKSLDYFLIFDASCKHIGIYTCFTYGSNSTVTTLKEFVVKVSVQAAQNRSVCGKAGEDLWIKSDMCIPSTKYDYLCCNYYIPPPERLLLNTKFSSTLKSRCEDYTNQSYTPWKINATWILPDNATWIWGWQVKLTGLDNNLGVKSCVQINSKDKLLNWTFEGLPFGGKYEIKIQALPSDEKNYLVKNTILPRMIDICEDIGRECQWEVCFPVQDLQQKETTSVLMWRPSKYYKTQHYFEITYESSDVNCSDRGRRKVEHATRIDLIINRCQSYHVKVRPIFSITGEGTFSNATVFYPPARQDPSRAEYTDIIVSCSIAIAILIVVLIIILLIKRNRKRKSPPDPPLIFLNPGDADPVIVANKTEVLIVHVNHCRLCNNVTHALARVLDKTGYIKCILDIFCTNEIAERGMSWYEDKIKSCDKIIVVCTKDGKKKWDEKKNKQEGPYIFILKTLLGQIVNHGNKNLQIVPIYFDISSNEDVPLFLSQYKCYSMPSHLQDLCSALRTHFTDSSTEGPSEEITQSVGEFKDAIQLMRRDHKGTDH